MLFGTVTDLRIFYTEFQAVNLINKVKLLPEHADKYSSKFISYGEINSDVCGEGSGFT